MHSEALEVVGMQLKGLTQRMEKQQRGRSAATTSLQELDMFEKQRLFEMYHFPSSTKAGLVPMNGRFVGVAGRRWSAWKAMGNATCWEAMGNATC